MSARGSQAGSDRGSQTASQKSRGRQQKQQQKDSQCSSPRSVTSSKRSSHQSPNRGRHNKIYHTPPTPPPEVMWEKEKSFILDSKAVASISSDYSKANPKLGPVIPPYNASKDKHVKDYFGFHGVERTMKKTMPLKHEPTLSTEAQEHPYTSIDGHVMDRFHEQGFGHIYLSQRNQFGAGHSRELVDGHAQFMEGVKPVIGYNGKFGYRRTTPWLRMQPSPFGTASSSPTH